MHAIAPSENTRLSSETEKEAIMVSGATPCACRDCMQIAISNDRTKPDLCNDCQEAGCSDYLNTTAEIRERYGNTWQYNCQGDHSYVG